MDQSDESNNLNTNSDEFLEDYFDNENINLKNNEEITINNFQNIKNDNLAELTINNFEDKKVENAKFVVVNNSLDGFDENEENKYFALDEKAKILKDRLKNSEITIENAEFLVKSEIKKLKIEWPALFGDIPTKIYAHVDLDSFYASVETLLHPEFKDVPLGVGTNLMLATTNYKAREFNVKAGMPGFHAKKLCPHLVITPCNFKQYNIFSEKVMEVLSTFDPQIEIYGIDEACLVFDDEKLQSAYKIYNSSTKYGKDDNEDFLEYKNFSIESVFELIDKIRKVVFRNTKLTISAGVSVCRGFAKFASNIEKPNGQFLIKENFDSHILSLKVDKVNGIGKMTKEVLRKTVGIVTIEDLRKKLPECAIMYKAKSFFNLLRLSFGLSLFDNPGSNRKTKNFRKSIGMGYTIKKTTDYSEICSHLWDIAGIISYKLVSRKIAAQIITLTIKYTTFSQITRQTPCKKPVTSREEIFDISMKLISQDFIVFPDKTKKLNEPIRLLGISAGRLLNLEKTNTIDKYAVKKSIVDIRQCFICKEEFIHESKHVFEAHVNFCVDKLERKEKAEKNTLFWYMKKKS